MGLKDGSIIKSGDYLAANDYIQSPSGLFYAIQQSDGNFCVYKGTGPNDTSWECLWATNQLDPLVSFAGNYLEYDLANTQILLSGPAELYRDTVPNSTAVSQTTTISASETITETSQWSNAIGGSVSVKTSTTLQVGIPLFADGKVNTEVTATFNESYTWGKSVTRSKT